MLHKAFKIEEDTLHSGTSAQAVVNKRMCRWVTSVPADGYPGGRVTAMPDRGQIIAEEEEIRRKGRQGANASYS